MFTAYLHIYSFVHILIHILDITLKTSMKNLESNFLSFSFVLPQISCKALSRLRTFSNTRTFASNFYYYKVFLTVMHHFQTELMRVTELLGQWDLRMVCGRESSMRALGTLDLTTPILGSISISPWGAGWSLVGFSLHKDPTSDQSPTNLAPRIGGMKS